LRLITGLRIQGKIYETPLAAVLTVTAARIFNAAVKIIHLET
jgi:hypothetical protein